MNAQLQDLIKKSYAAFNSRNIDALLSALHPDVEWPQSFEGGYLSGHDAVRAYWTKQWSEIDVRVEPIAIADRADGTVEVVVHQNVKDMQGNAIVEGIVKHVYTLQEGLLRRMDIEIG